MSEWQLLDERHREADGVWHGRARLAKGSLWFDGHFPDLPVLPAVAMLYAALAVADPDKRAKAIRMKHVRFRRAVAPGAELAIAASEPGPASQPFRLSVVGDVVCSGSLQAFEE